MFFFFYRTRVSFLILHLDINPRSSNMARTHWSKIERKMIISMYANAYKCINDTLLTRTRGQWHHMHVTWSLPGKVAYQTYHILWIHQIECLRGINVHGWGWNKKFTLSWICWKVINHSDLDSWSTKLVKGHCIPCYQWAFCWGSWRITEQWGGEREKIPRHWFYTLGFKTFIFDL